MLYGGERKQSDTGYHLFFMMIDSSDHITGKTGLSPTVTISKAGGSYASPSGAITEIANGVYKIAGNATDSNTLGPLMIHASSTGADPMDIEYRIVNYDPFTFLPDVNAAKLGGTSQTGRDIGASVLLSTGTGTGQLDFTSGVVKANLAQILGTALTETAGYLAAAFKKFFNIATPTGTVNSLPDAVAGASGGLPTTNGTKINQTVDLTAGQTIVPGAAPTDWLTASAVKADAVTKIQSGLATPTNITAGTITTVTNLTNAPTAGDFTAAMKTSLNSSTPASIQNIPATGSGFTALGDTRIANLDATITSRAAASTALSTATWTNTKAGYLDASISGVTAPSAATVAAAVRDVNNTSPAANSLGAAVNSASAPTASQNAVAVWNELLSGHSIAGSASVYLKGAGAAGDPWLTVLPGAYTGNQAGSLFSDIKTKTDTLGGPGAITWTYTLTNSVTGAPIANASVWITTDARGANIIATASTNQYGVATFQLNAGQIYVWCSKTGFTFSNPTIRMVTP
jgi:hypothetical protein